jgi:broad specificity phosphatase PhoE
VRAISGAALGQEEVAPEALLSLLLSILFCVLSFLVFVPKARLALWSNWYFLLSRDKTCRKPVDGPPDFSKESARRVKIVFIRHGESEWNAVFNVGYKVFLPFRLVRALITEMAMLFREDSIFFDAPLNKVGIQQAWDLLIFLSSQPAGCTVEGSVKKPCAELEVQDLVSIIRGDVGESLICASILKRAISTGLMCLSPRLLQRPEEKVHIMTALQELGRNVDSLSITPESGIPVVPSAEGAMQKMGDLMRHFYEKRLNAKLNIGNKNFGLKAVHRQDRFVKWAFEQKTDCIIVAGHSLWFREFFKSFLPKQEKHVAKTTKMVNCGVIAFDLYKDAGPQDSIFIDPRSIKEVRGGFEVKKGKEKKV